MFYHSNEYFNLVDQNDWRRIKNDHIYFVLIEKGGVTQLL